MLYEVITQDENIPEIEEQKKIYDFLKVRGASFMQRISAAMPDISVYDTLLQMLEEGLVTADSFLPVRQWLMKDMLLKAPVKRRAMVKSKAMMSGRWEIRHPIKLRTGKELLYENFHKTGISYNFV